MAASRRYAAFRRCTQLGETPGALADLAVILVVEDHPDTARFLCRLLQKRGYDTRCASDGVEALALLNALSPRLIILDVQMPRMTGFEVLEVMSENERLSKIPVIIYSAAHEKSQSDLALRLGARAYLVKGATGIPEMLAIVSGHAGPPASTALPS